MVTWRKHISVNNDLLLKEKFAPIICQDSECSSRIDDQVGVFSQRYNKTLTAFYIIVTCKYLTRVSNMH
jgi:hypothetical protein